MKDYDKLTHRGRLARLRPLAAKALEHYGLAGSRLDYHSYETNILYRVKAGTGERYIMRLASPGWRTRENLMNETLWLKALEKEEDIPAPRVIPTRKGESLLTLGPDDRVPHRINITLFTYLPGRVMTGLTEERLFKMGCLFARLHIQGKGWQRPAEFTSHVFDSYLSRGEEEALFSREVLSGLDRRDVELLYSVRDRVQEEYDNLDREDLRVIHCDLWHENIKVYRGELCPFDFEDTILGYRLHDIAMAMLDLKEDGGGDSYPELLASFRRGYESLLDWPEGNMEVFQAGRILWQLNWFVRFWPAGFENKMKGSTDFFKSLLTEGAHRV